MFKGKKGKQLEKELGQKTKSAVAGPGAGASQEPVLSTATSGRTPQEVDAIKVWYLCMLITPFMRSSVIFGSQFLRILWHTFSARSQVFLCTWASTAACRCVFLARVVFFV